MNRNLNYRNKDQLYQLSPGPSVRLWREVDNEGVCACMLINERVFQRSKLTVHVRMPILFIAPAFPEYPSICLIYVGMVTHVVFVGIYISIWVKQVDAPLK